MKINWRVSAITAGGAFLLSMLVGIIGGVGFGAILLRALLLGVVFGAASIGMKYAIARFLPELLETSGGDSGAGQARSVDIVVDDDATADIYRAAEADDEAATGVEGRGASGATGESGAGVGDEIDGGVLSDDSDIIVEEDEEEPEELESAEDEDRTGLPDVDGFSGSFNETADESEDFETSSIDSREDPSIMARAIQTVLKRQE